MGSRSQHVSSTDFLFHRLPARSRNICNLCLLEAAERLSSSNLWPPADNGWYSWWVSDKIFLYFFFFFSIGTLLNLPRYSYSMHWGHKEPSAAERRHCRNAFAGTSTRHLEKVNPSLLYGGFDGIDDTYSASYASPSPRESNLWYSESSLYSQPSYTSIRSRQSEIPLLSRTSLHWTSLEKSLDIWNRRLHPRILGWTI